MTARYFSLSRNNEQHKKTNKYNHTGNAFTKFVHKFSINQRTKGMPMSNLAIVKWNIYISFLLLLRSFIIKTVYILQGKRIGLL
jgi:uncharacterized membrane protein (DUF485 family)